MTIEERSLKELSDMAEFQDGRKESGSFYTPSDLADFLVANSFYNYIYENNHKVLSYTNSLKALSRKREDIERIISASVFDSTAGAGELLMSALKFKIDILLKANYMIDEKIIIKLVRNLYGNDINRLAIESMKKRIIIFIRKYYNNANSEKKIKSILDRKINQSDYIDENSYKNKRFNIIVGNPPYVEDEKYTGVLNKRYGNIYCNVLAKNIKNLSTHGVAGLIVPISYVSTPRMSKIRAELKVSNISQLILNYSDRPDCLFTGVHQKLNVIWFKRNGMNEIYSSNYKYWKKEERKELFSDSNLLKINKNYADFIPKLGNVTDKKIFNKVYSKEGGFYKLSNDKEPFKLYLNMRAAFWVKCFLNKKNSSEYKEFAFNEKEYYFIYCVLNSSLFFWYWTVVSDCWHITNKELLHFDFGKETTNQGKFKDLAIKLEKRLEETKHYIGSKQVEYEYKHKMCKDIIDEMDHEIANIYGLSKEESDYIINYNIKYRMSD